MSDMPRHAQTPRPPAHDQHDPLLVAQLAAGDPLDPARAQEAGGWLASCPDCAALAADLRRVSVAVADEGAPPRRRDFRLTPEQAEQLRGNAVTRFIRGLSFPRSRAFGPAAAGITSVGLVFVVAGYAWPEDASITVEPDANVAPAAIEAPLGSAPAPAMEVVPRTEERQPPTEGREPLAPAAAGQPEDAALEEAIDAFAADADALEGLAEHQAGTSAASETMRKAIELELADEVELDGALGYEEAASRVLAQEVGEAAGDAAEPEADVRGTADDLAAISEQVNGAGADETSAAAESPIADEGLERWLILLGVVLALGGGSLLLIAWFSRRSADPLLR